jgi:hypothetical protein
MLVSEGNLFCGCKRSISFITKDIVQNQGFRFEEARA